jgi:hypothetical protein
MTLSVSRDCSVSDAMINDLGTVVGMRTGRRNQSTRTELSRGPDALGTLSTKSSHFKKRVRKVINKAK